MSLGPGKYDHLCTLVRKKAKAEGAAVIVLGGDKGNGFSMQCEPLLLMKLPDILESMAKEIREKGPFA